MQAEMADMAVLIRKYFGPPASAGIFSYATSTKAAHSASKVAMPAFPRGAQDHLPAAPAAPPSNSAVSAVGARKLTTSAVEPPSEAEAIAIKFLAMFGKRGLTRVDPMVVQAFAYTGDL